MFYNYQIIIDSSFDATKRECVLSHYLNSLSGNKKSGNSHANSTVQGYYKVGVLP